MEISEESYSQNSSWLITSPPSRVMSFFMTFGSTLSLMNRTEPSANEKLVPPGVVAEDALQVELGIHIPVVGPGPDHGAVIAGVHDEDRVRGTVGDLLDLDALRAREDGRFASRGQVGRLGEVRAVSSCRSGSGTSAASCR